MAKRAGLVGVFAIAVLVFLIWNDPTGAASAVGDFFSWSAEVASDAWERLGDFLSGLFSD